MPASTPDVIIEPFGASAGGSYINQPIPVPSTGSNAASFHDGFPAETMTPEGAGGVPMLGPDMNGILYMITAYLAAYQGGQFSGYNATWSGANSGYALGAVVAMAAGNGFWINTSSGNTNNPDTTAAATSGWVPLAAYGTTTLTTAGGSVTLTAPQASMPILILNGTLTSSLAITVPKWAQRWRIFNNLVVGVYGVTVGTGTGPTVSIPAFGATGFTDVSVDQYGNIALLGMTATGSFTGTLAGVSGVVSGTFDYRVDGINANIFVPNGTSIIGTSNANDLYVTGVPGFLVPNIGTASNSVPCPIYIGSTFSPGFAEVEFNGGSPIISFALQQGANTGSIPAYSTIGFPTSGSKGLGGGTQFGPYPLQ